MTAFKLFRAGFRWNVQYDQVGIAPQVIHDGFSFCVTIAPRVFIPRIYMNQCINSFHVHCVPQFGHGAVPIIMHSTRETREHTARICHWDNVYPPMHSGIRTGRAYLRQRRTDSSELLLLIVFFKFDAIDEACFHTA